MSQIRVNIRHRVANSAIRRETRNGRDVIVVPCAVAKFNTVLNGIMYPEAELRASYEQINNLPAPIGHPVINNQYVSARDPEAINQFWVGAWNTAARIDGDRVMAEKVVDVKTAQETERGRSVLKAIDDGDPISTSTALRMDRDPAPDGADYDSIGRNFVFDHDAILLNGSPAIGTDEGVGMMVNSAGEQVEVINSEMNDDDELMTMMAFELVEQNEYREKRKRNASMVERIKNAIKAAFNGADDEYEADGLTTNSQPSTGEPKMTKEELQAALAEQADALKTNQAEAIAEAIKPLQDKIDALEAEKQAAADAEHATAVEAVVNAKLMAEDQAKALPTAALNVLVAAAPKTAAPLVPGFAANADDSRFDTLPE